MKCEKCGATENVFDHTEWWSTWGRNAFDFNWVKITGHMYLCEECETDGWVYCTKCSALLPREDEGKGYLPEDYDGDYWCPECAEKEGFEISVGIGPAPWNT